MKTPHVVVIGSGIGGLSAAALLAKEGYRVTVLEKNEQLGGRASVLEEKGFRFDMGPSWYMMPDVFERFYNEFGKTTADFFSLAPLKPQYRVFFDDHTHVDVSGDLEEDIATFERLEPGCGPNFRKYLAISQEKYDVAMRRVLYKNTDSILDFISPELARKGLKIGALESMHHHVSHFFKNKRLQQILEYNLVFLGCSPQNAPALFSLMTHVDINLGVWYPKGGIYAIVESMKQLGEEHGVEYVLNAPVTKLVTKDAKIVTVQTTDHTYHPDLVVSNADYWATENLLSDQTLRSIPAKAWDKKTLTPSAFLMYIGVRGKLPSLTHHNLYFGDGWEKHFSEVFDTPQWPVSPSIYINMTSATDPSVAPKGHENLMVLVPIAPGLEENDAWRASYAQYIIKFIEHKLQLSLKDRIVYQKIFSATDFTERFNSLGGNALGGLAHTLFQSAIWRPNNISKRINNLYFSGANTVPGIGVPPAVISGHLVRDRIVKDTQKGSR